MNYLFWSGGKDAFLAWHFWRERRPEAELTLLTTYNEETGVVPHQQIPMENIRRQAGMMALPLAEVALPPECPNETYLEKVREAFAEHGQPGELIFGDWKLEEVRAWREKHFGERCRFPIWKKDLDELMTLLTLLPVEVRISAVREEFRHLLKPGERYGQGLVRQLLHLGGEIDPMGENGEFHTEVRFADPPKPV
ncbi:MAG: hypothetical protein U5K31_03925 [Balneolaceae bacterium]|nr:hypothetical protein [Balneolaceae bacterium]